MLLSRPAFWHYWSITRTFLAPTFLTTRNFSELKDIFSARIYGIEEPTTPWVINSTDEEQQRIIITENINNCETGSNSQSQQQSTSRLSKKQQMENREKEKVFLIIFKF